MQTFFEIKISIIIFQLSSDEFQSLVVSDQTLSQTVIGGLRAHTNYEIFATRRNAPASNIRIGTTMEDGE